MRALLLALLSVSIACGSSEGTSSTQPTPAAPVGSHEVLRGSGATEDDADPRVPWVPRERIALVAADDPLFHLALASDLVVEAHGFEVGWSQFREPTRSEPGARLASRGHRSLSATVDRVLLGDLPGDRVRFDVYCAPPGSAPDHSVPCDRLRQLVSAPSERAVLFLAYANGSILYFAGHTPDALQASAPENALRAMADLRSVAPARVASVHAPAIARQVDGEVARITRSARDQYDAMRALVALGPEAIPAIVAHMHDRRRLPSGAVPVENPPDFWEAYAHYGLGEVVDALFVVASRSTNGPSCTALLHAREDRVGATERERCRRRWTEFVARGLDEGAFGAAWR